MPNKIHFGSCGSGRNDLAKSFHIFCIGGSLGPAVAFLGQLPLHFCASRAVDADGEGPISIIAMHALHMISIRLLFQSLQCFSPNHRTLWRPTHATLTYICIYIYDICFQVAPQCCFLTLLIKLCIFAL